MVLPPTATIELKAALVCTVETRAGLRATTGLLAFVRRRGALQESAIVSGVLRGCIS